MIFIVTAQKGEGTIFMAQASNLLFWPSPMPDMALLHVEAQCPRFKILFARTLKSQPVKKTDGAEFRHPDIPCFEVMRLSL